MAAVHECSDPYEFILILLIVSRRQRQFCFPLLFSPVVLCSLCVGRAVVFPRSFSVALCWVVRCTVVCVL